MVSVMLDRVDECSQRLDEVLKTIPIENITFVTLKKIKTTLEKNGKIFKYTLPPKVIILGLFSLKI